LVTKLISTLLFSARVTAAAVLPALWFVSFASADQVDGMSAAWYLLAPAGWLAIVFVGWLDGKIAVAITAAWCGMIFAIAAHIEQDSRPLPICKGLLDGSQCKNDAEPEDGVGVFLFVLAPGGVVALIPAGRRRRAEKTAALESS
jgi:hypothetical protein